MKFGKDNIIAIVGPTAAGKSDIAVRIAKAIGGEVVSADSRQIYKGLDIGSGKITPRETRGVPHYMLDVADPKRTFTVAQYQKQALKEIARILKRGKIPVLVGGTGLYIQAIIDGVTFPEVKPNAKLRKKLEGKSAAELAAILKKLDKKRYLEIDIHNPRRLVRAIEIAKALGSVPPIKKTSDFTPLLIGIRLDDEILKKKIHARLLKRMKVGMVAEAKRLHAEGLSYKRMDSLGLEYRYLAAFLQKKLSKEEMIEQLSNAIWHYAKRQITWFKKDKRIKWFEPGEYEKIESKVRNFLKN
ncbi:MAG TPA: tRNA (adenosine(37)-N6)-dimethylallyltransferase MiaA [Candidatus Paceibacterota bacterium]|nr:tRNA (adenosine(37)-N6)-dimethylallyltransferase MiaA [Candidatus Paceibacterota bacterium]